MRPIADRCDEPTTISVCPFRFRQRMQARRRRVSGEELQPALGHRGQILTDLLEGRLGNLALEPLVLPLREQAGQLAEGMHVCDHNPAPSAWLSIMATLPSGRR